MNKTKYAYTVIKDRILDGTYAPGQRIILDQIAKEIGSSHIPVREAIRRLEADNLIEYRPNAGALVLSIDEKVYKQTLEMLAVLEGYATKLSIGHMNDEHIEEIKAINEDMKECLQRYDLNRFSELNKSFHFAIYSHCPNQLLVEDIRASWEKLDTVRSAGFAYFPMRAPYSVEEHDQLIDLIEDPPTNDAVEAFARQHKLNTLDAYENRA
ncbi:GntR family transcriptional regulator [Salibacterium qingdaonense]|uniref:Transcriptional regulator, GntR family n=1 Tax=Salibacterium qingdaonense TaxID=266892 RepID=A0A1I4HZU7_9BACI|nr:GntR family transcriptional regulator [Salibacterium qingdaonense]SFL47213.1 transcriptional regulator, GntR family [Salibacterium qingdaonense]